MILQLIIFDVVLLSIGISSTINSYTESDVLNFINGIAHTNVSAACIAHLNSIEQYVTNTSQSTERQWYTESYSVGSYSDFLSRSHDRWVYRAIECLKSAGETAFEISQHPMHFCYGFTSDRGGNGDTAYGLCIPSQCASDSIQLLNSWQSYASGSDAVNSSAITKFDDQICTQSRHDQQWYEKSIAVGDFVLNMLLLLLLALATIYHCRYGTSTRSMSAQVLLAFSVKKNLSKLTEMPKDPQSMITCFFGMRFLSMVWTLIGHSFIFFQVYVENVDQFKTDITDYFFNQWITNFTLSVDTFLVLSGTLTAYSWFRKWQKNTTETEPSWYSFGYWLRFYRHRIVRLWPAYAYTLLVVTNRISITHYHPLWPPTDPSIQCPKHWWENLLFVNSLLDNRCMPWTWYIGTEFIFYLLSPIFLLSLRKSATIGLIVATTAIAISTALRALIIIAYNFPPTQFLWSQPAIFNPDFIEHHLVIYIKPQTRIGPYIVGLLLGYYLAIYQHRPIKQQIPSQRFQLIGWSSATIAGFWSLYGLYPALQGWNWPVYHVMYGAIHRLVFALSIGWLIFACHTGIGGFINTLLSHRYLIPLSSLCYGVYLFHMIPVVLTYLLADFPMVWTNQFYVLIHCFVQLVLSYGFGFLCAITAELPALNIERLLLNGSWSAGGSAGVQISKTTEITKMAGRTEDCCDTQFSSDGGSSSIEENDHDISPTASLHISRKSILLSL